MSKCIKDFRGYVQHWIIDKNSFIYDFTNYEKDEYNGRCYMLIESCNLRPERTAHLSERESAKMNTKKPLKK